MAGYEQFRGPNSFEVEGRVLHPEYFVSPFGAAPLEAFKADVREQNDALNAPRERNSNRTPDLTLAIQSCNESPDEIVDFLKEARSQADRYAGKVQMLVLKAGPHSSVGAIARSFGAEVIDVEMGPGFRADIQNKALEVADHNSVLFGIGHTAIAYNRWLETAGFEISGPNVMAAYGTALPNRGATLWERLGARTLGADKLLAAGRKPAEASSTGLLASDCSVVKKDLIERVTGGGYPVEYGFGGQDGRLGNMLLEWSAEQHAEDPSRPRQEIIFNPLLSVHHTDGLDAVHTFLRACDWYRMGKPRPHAGANQDFIPPHKRYGGF